LNLKPDELRSGIGTDEMEHILDLKANLDYYKSLIAHAVFYLITFKWPMVAINAETVEYRDLDFKDENWEKCLINPGLGASKISLGVRTGSLSRLLVLEVANEKQKSRLDGWGIWRSKWVAELGTGLERHFYEMPADFQPISSNISGTDIRIYGEGDLTPLPPSIDSATRLEWRWQGPAWGSTPTPLPSAIINFLQALQQPSAAASEFQDKHTVPWQSPSDGHQAMNMKDTEMTSHSPGPLPGMPDSPSIPSATMPVLDKAIQEFSAAFNKPQGIIREFASQEQHYLELFTGAPGGYLVTDTEATIQECNQAAADMLGTHKDFLLGKRLNIFVTQKDYYTFFSLMDQALEGNETRTATVHFLPSSGTPIPVFLAIAGRKNPAGEFVGVNCLINPFTQGQQGEESLKNKITQPETYITELVNQDNSAPMAILERLRELQDQAYLDELTRIGNRRYLEIFLAARFNELERFDRPFGVIFADLDHFKQVNDTFGHQVGDSILKMVAETMVKNCRSHDLAGRWGGEEFLWVLGNLQDEGQLKTAAERLRNLVANYSLTLPDHEVMVTISLGATMARPQDTLETLIRRVDSLLYLSKAAGRNFTTIG